MTNELDCDIVLNEFEIQSQYNVLFLILAKKMLSLLFLAKKFVRVRYVVIPSLNVVGKERRMKKYEDAVRFYMKVFNGSME